MNQITLLSTQKIKELRYSLIQENISLNDIVEIENDFQTLVKIGAQLRDLPENATVADMLDELEKITISTVHKNTIKPGDTIIYQEQITTVCPNNIKNDPFMGVSIFGDAYPNVQKVTFNTKQIGPVKDVHTEHCCAQYGCKYGEEDSCPVWLGYKKQSFGFWDGENIHPIPNISNETFQIRRENNEC